MLRARVSRCGGVDKSDRWMVDEQIETKSCRDCGSSMQVWEMRE